MLAVLCTLKLACSFWCQILTFHNGDNGFDVVTITVLCQFFLDTSRAITAFTAVKSLFDLGIKHLAAIFALNGLVAMLTQ